MLSELHSDNQLLAKYLRHTHEVCDQGNDVATASLIENWIDETERRIWFLAKISQEIEPAAKRQILILLTPSTRRSYSSLMNLKDILADPGISYWLKDAIRPADERDPIDALTTLTDC